MSIFSGLLGWKTILEARERNRKRQYLYNGLQCCKLNVKEVCGKRKERTAMLTERNRDFE